MVDGNNLGIVSEYHAGQPVQNGALQLINVGAHVWVRALAWLGPSLAAACR